MYVCRSGSHWNFHGFTFYVCGSYVNYFLRICDNFQSKRSANSSPVMMSLFRLSVLGCFALPWEMCLSQQVTVTRYGSFPTPAWKTEWKSQEYCCIVASGDPEEQTPHRSIEKLGIMIVVIYLAFLIIALWSRSTEWVRWFDDVQS